MTNDAYVCPTCYLEQTTADGFCRDCGTQVVQLRYCESCGVKARGAEDFCRECGARLSEAVPFNPANGKTDAASAPAPAADPPAWLKGSDPAPRRNTPVATATRPQESTPDWLRENRRADDNILVPRSAPKAITRAPAPKPVSTSPVLVRRTPVATDSRTRNLQALLGLLFAVLGVALASPGSLVFAFALIVIAMIVGGKPLLEMSTAGLQRVIDWIWEDPVLRKRMLDE